MLIVNEGNPYEEETHAAPANAPGSDESTKVSGQSEPPPAYWANRGSADTRKSGSPSKRGSSTNWLIPALVVACAFAVLGIVLLLAFRGNGSSAKATSPAPAPRTVSSATPSMASSSSGNSGTSSTSTSAEPTAGFPAGVSSTCGGGAGHETEAVAPLADGVRVSATDGHAPSCAFVNNVVSYVHGEVKKNPNAEHFNREDHSVRSSQETYDERCTREQHLTTCNVGGPHNYMVYVRD